MPHNFVHFSEVIWILNHAMIMHVSTIWILDFTPKLSVIEGDDATQLWFSFKNCPQSYLSSVLICEFLLH